MQRWKKSTFSGDSGNCAEIELTATVGVRDSKHPTHELRFTPAAWRLLLQAVSEQPTSAQRR